MSIVISSIPPAGFNEIPPVSNTTPLPTNVSRASSSAAPNQLIITSLQGLEEPCPTPKKAFIPRLRRSSSSKISILIPNFDNSSSRLANSSVVRIFEGSFIRLRVRKTPSLIATSSCNWELKSSGSLVMTVIREEPSDLLEASTL